MSAGEFYFDYAASRIYIANNPAGHKVEAAVAPRAFVSGASGVTVRGLTVELFANEAGAGAIWANYDWLVENCEVRLNHAVGIAYGGTVRNNYIHDNGQAGITSYQSTGMLVENNEIAYNNYAGFDSHYDGGGTKFMRTRNLTLRGNNVHHNYGTGLWLDTDNTGALVEKNTTARNDGPGILHETGFKAIIRNNTVRRNGFNFHSGWIDGSGILLLASNNTQIYGNRLERNREGIGLTQTDRGPTHITQNIDVHHNTIMTVTGTTAAGFVQSTNDPSYFTSKNIRFHHNTYVLCAPSYFAWRDPSGNNAYAYLTRAKWVAAGNDTTGASGGCRG